MARPKQIKLGRRVRTLKGDRSVGGFEGTVVAGPGQWRQYTTWTVKKDLIQVDGPVIVNLRRRVTCLEKNLVVVD